MMLELLHAGAFAVPALVVLAAGATALYFGFEGETWP